MYQQLANITYSKITLLRVIDAVAAVEPNVAEPGRRFPIPTVLDPPRYIMPPAFLGAFFGIVIAATTPLYSWMIYRLE